MAGRPGNFSMNKRFQIFIDRLKDEHKEIIQEVVDSSFLKLEEEELSFPENISISGETYLANEHLVLSLKIYTSAILPCRICNAPVKISIRIEDFYHSEMIENIPSAIFNYSDEIRTAILLKLPQYAECLEGKCPERIHIKQYLKDSQSAKESIKISNYFPFAELDK